MFAHILQKLCEKKHILQEIHYILLHQFVAPVVPFCFNHFVTRLNSKILWLNDVLQGLIRFLSQTSLGLTFMIKLLYVQQKAAAPPHCTVASR